MTPKTYNSYGSLIAIHIKYHGSGKTIEITYLVRAQTDYSCVVKEIVGKLGLVKTH